MIKWGSIVRIGESRRLGFVCDLDEGACGDSPDPACVCAVELFKAGCLREEWERHECFLCELDEVAEAQGTGRSLACTDFEYLRIDNYWVEDTPLKEHRTIWVVMEGEEASVWLERGYVGPVEPIAHLAPSKVATLKEAFGDVCICNWKRDYDRKGWRLGGNAWRMTFIRGSAKASTGGIDGYHASMEPLCEALRHVGLPVGFRDGHRLVYSPLKKGSRKTKKPVSF